MAIGTTAALLVGGGLLGSAAISSGASSAAGRQIQQGTDAAVAEQRRQFDELLRLSRPGLDRANAAAGTYMQALGLGGGGAQAPGGYASQPAGVQSGGYTGASHGGSGLQGGDQTPDYAVGPGQRLMTGGLGGEYGPQTLPPAQGSQAQQGGQGGGQLDIAAQVMGTPGYQAQLDQGIKSIDRAAPLVGGMYSGRRMKALEGHGQQTFGSYYNDWMNRVGGMAGQAPQIAQSMGQAGMQNANNVGQLMMTGANARAQGTQNSASAWTGAIGTGIGLYGGSQGWMGR